MCHTTGFDQGTYFRGGRCLSGRTQRPFVAGMIFDSVFEIMTRQPLLDQHLADADGTGLREAAPVWRIRNSHHIGAARCHSPPAFAMKLRQPP